MFYFGGQLQVAIKYCLQITENIVSVEGKPCAFTDHVESIFVTLIVFLPNR